MSAPVPWRPLSRLGLGLAAIGRPAYITPGRAGDIPTRDPAAMEAQARAVLDAAWGGGIRVFDAAASYGASEAFLAGWLASRGIGPGEAAVSSKWGYVYVGGWQVAAERHEVKDLTLPRFREQLAESRARLGPWLGLHQVHSLTLESGALGDPSLLGALAALKGEGITIGFSATGPAQGATIDAALGVELDGRPLFDAVQATWNLLERSAAPALSRAKAAGRAVIVKEALANGRLLSVPGGRPGVAPDALALAAALAQPFADVVLSGAATEGQVRANLAALAVPGEAVEAALAAVPAEAPGAYWQRRAGLPWT